MKKPFYKILYIQVLFAIACGIALGHFLPGTGEAMKPLGDGFIKLIKMLIAPIIFCTVVVGIAGIGNMKKAGRVGGKALLYFEVVSTLALVIGLLVVHVLKPGEGMNMDVATITSKTQVADAKALTNYTNAAQTQKQGGITEFLLNVIPTTVVDAFAKGDILQVLLVSVLVGFAFSVAGEKSRGALSVIEAFSHALFLCVDFIMKLAPIGAFGAMAFTIGKFGLASLIPLMKFMGGFYACCLLFVFVVLGSIARWCGFSILKFIVYIKEELWIVLGTSSSESVLPRIMTKLQNLGCSKAVVGLVIPTGYSFNLDGTAIYLTMAAVFIAQATNTSLTMTQEFTLLAVLLLTSKGASGVTGSGFITLAMTLAAVPTIPVAGLALILGIDRFMSEARALTNLIGNGVATVAIARWEKELDVQQMERVMQEQA